MFSSKPNFLKLRTNLRLCINRLRLLEKKKTELALKARREIADYITAGKDDRARIRVEHIIREDYLVEAMEIVEMLCDLLLARFGLIERMPELDPGIEEAVATLIWVAPRLCGDVQEMREVAHQLTIKYGKEFSEVCRRNGFENVNEKIVHKMSLASPPKILVEHYMIEIARTYKVPFEPDPLVMTGQPNVSNLIDLGVDALAPTAGNAAEGRHILRDSSVAGNQGVISFPSVPGSVSGKPGSQGEGFAGDFGGGANSGGYPIYSNTSSPGNPGPFDASINSCAGFHNNFNINGSAAGATDTDYSSALVGGVPVLPSEGHFPPPIPPGYLPPSGMNPFPPYPSDPASATNTSGSQPRVPIPTGARAPLNPQMSWINDDYLPSLPPYDQVVGPNHGFPASPIGGAAPSGSGAVPSGPGATLPDIPILPDVPGLPSIPPNSLGGSSVGGDDVDFDDLTRRFEELKNRK